VRELEERIAALAAEAERHVAPDRFVLLRLAEDFPRVWNHPSTDMRARKRIVRLLIEEIVVKILPGPRDQIELIIHWKGGKHTQLVLPRNRTGQHRHSTDRAIIDVVRDLSRVQSDGQIARVLNRLGYRTGAGNTWTALRVMGLRRHQGITAFDRAADRQGILTIAGAASVLSVSPTTARRMIGLGLLPATQPVLHAPWAIRQQDLERDTVRRAVVAIKAGRALPRTLDEGQLALAESTT
jgi:hypothetical protein